MKKGKDEFIHIRVRSEEKARLKQVCEDWDMTISECVRTLVDLAFISNHRDSSGSQSENFILGRH